MGYFKTCWRQRISFAQPMSFTRMKRFTIFFRFGSGVFALLTQHSFIMFQFGRVCALDPTYSFIFDFISN
jgi:hypothetical protein